MKDFHGIRVAFLGGIETEKPDQRSITEQSYQDLMNSSPGNIDILVVHDAPYGIGKCFHGNIQGSMKILNVVEKLQPRYLIGGHYHTMRGPIQYGNTSYLGLSVLVNPRHDPDLLSIQPGCMAILDTDFSWFTHKIEKNQKS